MSTTASNIASDSRLVQLLPWLQSLTAFKLDVSTIRPASSDASFRRYFRVDSDKDSYIVMDAPPDKEKIEPFIHVDELFKEVVSLFLKSLPKILKKAFSCFQTWEAVLIWQS